MADPPSAHIKIAFDGFELEMRGPVDDVRDVLAVLTDRLVRAFGKARDAALSQETKEG